MEKAIFLDKDGTLILDVPYNVNPSLVTLTKGAIEGLKKLSNAGFRFYVISNQQGISLGYFTANDLIPIRKKLENIFLTHGITLSDFYFCPHGDKDSCFCRKPQPGLIFQAAKDHQIDLKHSWLIGDSVSDIQAGKNAGCSTIFFDKRYENDWYRIIAEKPNYVVKNITDAANYILGIQNEDTYVSI